MTYESCKQQSKLCRSPSRVPLSRTCTSSLLDRTCSFGSRCSCFCRRVWRKEIDYFVQLWRLMLFSRGSIICLVREAKISIDWFRFQTGITRSQSTCPTQYKDFWLKYPPSSLFRARRRCHFWRLGTRILCGELKLDKWCREAMGQFPTKRVYTHCNLKPFGDPKLRFASGRVGTVFSSQSILCCRCPLSESQSGFQDWSRYSKGSSESLTARSRLRKW